jgi:hypothetical protein
MNKFDKRWANAVKIANAINEYIDKGCLIFDADGEAVTGRFLIVETGYDPGIYQQVNDNCSIMWFLKDIELDNGYYTPLKEYSDQFKGWKFVAPEHIQRLKL